MWEAISSVLTSAQAWQTLVTLVIIIILALLLVKSKALNINTSHVKIGVSSDTERRIIREQIDQATLYIKSLENYHLENIFNEEIDAYNYKFKYALEIILDEIVNWITFNHIESSEAYISVKQKKLWSLICTFDLPNDILSTDDFKNKIYQWTGELIKELVEVRELYKKG